MTIYLLILKPQIAAIFDLFFNKNLQVSKIYCNELNIKNMWK